MMSDPMPELGDWLDFALRRVPAQFKKSEGDLESRGSVNVERRYSRS
jgi:hypothetical protein